MVLILLFFSLFVWAPYSTQSTVQYRHVEKANIIPKRDIFTWTLKLCHLPTVFSNRILRRQEKIVRQVAVAVSLSTNCIQFSFRCVCACGLRNFVCLSSACAARQASSQVCSLCVVSEIDKTRISTWPQHVWTSRNHRCLRGSEIAHVRNYPVIMRRLATDYRCLRDVQTSDRFWNILNENIRGTQIHKQLREQLSSPSVFRNQPPQWLICCRTIGWCYVNEAAALRLNTSFCS